MAARYALRPWRWATLGFLLRRKADLLPALHDPLFVRDGVVHDRTVVFSRLIWRYWGGPQVVIPDLAITKANFEAAARRGIDVCKQYFPYFTLYAVMIRKFGNRPRYEMSAIPATGDDHVCGIEFSPLLEGASYSRDHFQRFKNAIYDVGLDLGGSYYRFGGVMKPYVRRMFGDEMVDRHRAMKQALDPAFILNRDVVFDPPEAARRERAQLRRLHRLRPVHPRLSGVRGDRVRRADRARPQQGAAGGPRRAGDGRVDLGLHAVRLLRRDLPERRPQRRDRAAPPARAASVDAATRLDRPGRARRLPSTARCARARLHDPRSRAASHPVDRGVPAAHRPPVGACRRRLLRLARRRGRPRDAGRARRPASSPIRSASSSTTRSSSACWRCSISISSI